MSDFFHPVRRMPAVFILLIALVTPCLAGSPLSIHMLEQIASKKNITLGCQDDALPFSWQNDNIPVGYSINICNSIASALKIRPRLKKLKVERVEASSAPQLVLIKNHMVNIMCILVFYSKSRHSVSELPLPFYFSSTRSVMCKNESNGNLAGLSGHSVPAKSGMTYVEQPQRVNVADDLDVNIQLDTNNITAFDELKNDEYSVLISNTVLLKGMIAQMPSPDDYELSNIALSTPLPADLLLSLHDKKFKGLVDDALSSLMISNEFTVLYKEWLQPPIPSKAINLNIPMLDNLRTLTSVKKKISLDYEKYN